MTFRLHNKGNYFHGVIVISIIKHYALVTLIVLYITCFKSKLLKNRKLSIVN